MTGERETEYRLEVRVTGRVQGVGYRAFSVRTARSLGVSGSVANNADGTVSVVGFGRKRALQAFLVELRKGPKWGRVESISESWCASDDPRSADFVVSR